ncbi:hypothetical protein SAMN05216298_3019 [Glycomyces sambucus]|uniref:Uncharacterized protein n=1 Tax=Glycomyces sambucus TaxID=380244 RepID=A0A1G9I3Z7_9ACTN|nr:hypothetical protein [Glycomyces sambucus]SDL19939.1 hypothetical protein SAMN05216298_3019 [Glycomyces sambucus]
MRRTAVVLAAATLVLTGCSDEPAEVTDDDVARIEQSLEQGSELAWELTQAETRVAATCMQDQGFTVHDRNLMHGMMVPNRFEGFDSPYARIPTVEQAGKFGFGYWVSATETDAALAMREDLDFLGFAGTEAGWDDPAEYEEYQEWSALGEEYQRAWLDAFHGPERAAYLEERNSGGGNEAADEPPFGGCELEAIEIVYGEPVHHEREWGSFWARPDLESPLTWVGDGELYKELSVRYIDQEQAFLDCVEDRGHGQWHFDDLGYLPVPWYVGQFYEGAASVEGVEVPPLSDAAEDADDPVAYEFAMALNFAECAESAGLREDAEETWARMYVEQMIDRESEVYAWEQQIQDYLANAQDHLAGG